LVFKAQNKIERAKYISEVSSGGVIMKKIAFAVVLCASASFSPALAQIGPMTFNTSGTVIVADVGSPRITVKITVTVPGTSVYKEALVNNVTFNGISALVGGQVDPDLRNKLSGATCRYVAAVAGGGNSAVCTK
jgi:hypothetical protein